MAVMDVQVFCQLMNSAIASNPMNVPNPAHAAWEGLMDQWWNKVSNLDYGDQLAITKSVLVRQHV
jgi:hypothetical protein